jgi:alkylation response protein AidB-like acyl-CoA dehydrogenase
MAQTPATHVDYEEERAAFQTTADEFVRRQVIPTLPQARSQMGCPRSVFDHAAEVGLLGVLAPESAGGFGLHDVRFGELVVAAAAQAGAPGTGLAIGLHSNVAVPAVVSGYHAQDEGRLTEGMADGSTLVAVAGLTGGVSGQLCGAGLQLAGTARGVVNAANADKYLVVVDIADAGWRVVLVDAQAANVLPPAGVLGGRDAGSRDVVFDGVHADSDATLVGERQAVDDLLMNAALVFSAVSVAGARAAVSDTVAYVQERKAFGRVVAEFENTRSVLTAVWAELLVAASYHDDCARRRGQSALRLAEAGAALQSSVALFDRAVDCGLQLHGGYGYMLEYPIAQAYADARFISLIAESMAAPRLALLADLGL